MTRRFASLHVVKSIVGVESKHTTHNKAITKWKEGPIGTHTTQVRVRLSETDAKGVVYYAQYFVYFDVARLELLRFARVDAGLMGRRRLRFVAAEAACRFRASAKFQDVLDLKVGIRKLGQSSVVFAHEIRRVLDHRLLAEGHIADVLVDGKGKPAVIPEDIRKKLSRFMVRERGK